MGQMVQLTTADGHTLDAYQADPAATPKGGLIIIQEVFGITGHVKRLSDSFAEAGYAVCAPAMFDRVEKNVELTYGTDDFAKGRELRGKLTDDWILADVEAAAKHLSQFGKVGLAGCCFGGYVAWISGTGLDSLACAASLYGGGVAAKTDRQPKCAMQMHFGDKDGGISLADVHIVKEAHPDLPVYVYDDAAHGFCTDDREGAFNARACARATGRILDLLAQHVG